MPKVRNRDIADALAPDSRVSNAVFQMLRTLLVASLVAPSTSLLACAASTPSDQPETRDDASASVDANPPPNDAAITGDSRASVDAKSDVVAAVGYCSARCAYEQRCFGKCTAECVGWNETKLNATFVSAAASCYATDKCATTGSSQGCIVSGLSASGMFGTPYEDAVRWCVNFLYGQCGGQFGSLNSQASETLCRDTAMLLPQHRTTAGTCAKGTCGAAATCIDATFR